MSSFILCTSGAAIAKAGPNADINIVSSGAVMNKFSEEVEGTFCMKTHKDWIGASAATTTPLSNSISDYCSDKIAMKVIQANMEGYTGLNEATAMVDILNSNADNIMKDIIGSSFQENLK